MKIPNYENAIIPKGKITDYLLSLSHRDGCNKARFFLRFGFSQAEWEVLSDALKQHVAQHEVARTERSYFGIRYVIEGVLVSPDGRNPAIRSVWFIDKNTNIPSFVTAYPLKGKAK